MIVSLSPPGVRCQVGDFVMLALPSGSASVATSAKGAALAKEGRLPKANLILYTEVSLPLDFPLPPEVVAGAGEYEISGVRVKGINLDKGASDRSLRTVYSAELEGARLLFLGELSDQLVGDALDKLGAVDILFLSAESSKIAGKELTKLIKQIDPKIIIPIGDKTAKLLSEELGQKVKAEEKLVIKKKDLDKEAIANKLVWLKS